MDTNMMKKRFLAAALAVVMLSGLGFAQLQKVRLWDTDLSHNLLFTWNENDTAGRTLNWLVDGADRSLTISGDSYIDQDVRIAATPTWASAILNHASADTRLQFSLAGVPKWTVGLDVSDSNKYKIASGDEFGNSHDVLNIAAYDGSTAGVSEFALVDTFAVGVSGRGICTDGLYLYYRDAIGDQLVKIDAITGAEIARSAAVTGEDFRKMAYGAGYVYVVNYDSGKIRKYDTDLTYIGQTDAWNGISGLCYWGGYLYACNDSDHDVKKIRCSDLTVIWTAAFTQGSGASQFDVARGITTDGDYLYVLDLDTNSRIVRLAIADGAWVDATDIATLDPNGFGLWIAGDWLYVTTDHGVGDNYAEKYLRADMTKAEEFAIASDGVYQACQYGDYHYIGSADPVRIYKYWFVSSASYTASGITFRLPDEFGQTRDLAKLTGEGNLGVGTIFPDERIEAHGNIKATLGQFISTIPTGTAPLSVVSTTVVPNLNVDQVDGYDFDQSVLTTDDPSFDHVHLTVATGTAPMVVTSTTVVPNLNVSALEGHAASYFEPALGNPDADGKVLSSTIAGARSWIAAGGALAVDDLTDVDAAAPDDQDVLTWDVATSKWIAQAPPAGGALALDDLTDVNAAAPDDEDVLTWDTGTSRWIAAPGGAGGAPAAAKYIVQEAHADLSAEQSLGALTTGLLKNTVAAGAGTLSTASYYDYSRHCWIRETFDGLATGSILGLGSYFEMGAWADDGIGVGGSASVAVKSGADKMLRIQSLSNTSSYISSTTTTSIGLSGGWRLHFKMRIDQNTAGYVGGVGVYLADNTEVFLVYFRYSTTFQITAWNGSSALKLMNANKDQWYTVDVFFGSDASGPSAVFVDGTFVGRQAFGAMSAKWTKMRVKATSPAAGATVNFDVDDLYFYSLFPLGLD